MGACAVWVGLHAGLVMTVAGNVFRAAGLTDGVGSEALLMTGSLELHCDASGGRSWGSAFCRPKGVRLVVGGGGAVI